MRKKRNDQKRKSPAAAGCSALGIFLLRAVIAVCIPLTLPNLFGYQAYTVISGSMEPEIPVGSLVYIQPSAPEDAEENDIVAFYGAADGSMITHRVVENNVLAGELTTKGDANKTKDMNPVSYADFIGTVRASIPLAGHAAQFLAGLPGKITAACVILCSLLLQAAAAGMERRHASADQSPVD